MYLLRVPTTEKELQDYYHFRWEMLRKPLHQPQGSEKDGYDTLAHHRMIVDETGKPVAIGRLSINADNEAAIRFMAVAPELRHIGLGKQIAAELELVARQEGVKRIVCSAREEAVTFFAGLGFINQGEIRTPRATPVRHFLMTKSLENLQGILYRESWCQELQAEWHRTIPLSEKMGLRICQYTGTHFETTMPESGNLNPHHTLFAGSLFSMATLTGWGLIWLLLKEQGLSGTIILADAHIRYQRPITGRPTAKADLNTLQGSLARLKKGRKVRLQLDVTLLGQSGAGAVFEGVFLVLPPEI